MISKPARQPARQPEISCPASSTAAGPLRRRAEPCPASSTSPFTCYRTKSGESDIPAPCGVRAGRSAAERPSVGAPAGGSVRSGTGLAQNGRNIKQRHAAQTADRDGRGRNGCDVNWAKTAAARGTTRGQGERDDLWVFGNDGQMKQSEWDVLVGNGRKCALD